MRSDNPKESAYNLCEGVVRNNGDHNDNRKCEILDYARSERLDI